MINLSFALEPGSAPSPLLNDAIADAVGRGITVVAGAGNNGSADPAANALAATNPQVIRVASIDTESHRLDAGSNRGAWVDVAASAELSAHGSGSAPVGNGGTSAAAAAVSAISGLLLSCNAAPHAGARQGHPDADVDAVRRRRRRPRRGRRLPGRSSPAAVPSRSRPCSRSSGSS